MHTDLAAALAVAAKLWATPYLRRNNSNTNFQVGYWLRIDDKIIFYIVGAGTDWTKAIQQAKANSTSNLIVAKEILD